VCGIVGYIGPKKVVPLILDGLRRLEYRGYDSAGIAVVSQNGHMEIRRASGKLPNLEESIRNHPIDGIYGLGHTRWATHGRPTEENAHPHRDCKGEIVVVHNGIVENYLELKQELEKEGHKFVTQTDTEIVAHLVEKYMDGGPLETAVRKAIKRLSGVYALVILSTKDPRKIVAARNGPPVVVGLGKDEYFVASDIPGILAHTRDIFFLSDGDIAVLTPKGVEVSDAETNPVQPKIHHVTWDPVTAEKGGFKHFMLKEIFEQPRAIRDTMLGRISQETGEVYLDEMQITEQEFRNFRNIKIVACGTSWHAGLAGKFMIERLAGVPVEVDYGSEFRYRNPIVDDGTLVICISQSGETADTLAAQREAKQKRAKTLAICNVADTPLTRDADARLLTYAGIETSIAATKSFTTQLTALFLLAAHIARVRGSSDAALDAALRLVRKLPDEIERALNQNDRCLALARKFSQYESFLFLGRDIDYPIALEGALKLKEVSYIHAEGYPTGEMKHGPSAMIDETVPVVVLAMRDQSNPASRLRFEKTLSNIRELSERGTPVIAVVSEGDRETLKITPHVVEVPDVPVLLQPIVEVVPLQLFAYHVAVLKGRDVDAPRHLSKSVVVE